MKTKKIIGLVVVIAISVIFVFAKVKRITPLSWGHNEVNIPMFSKIAINGYDAVSYFNKNKAVSGDKKYSYNWKNADWYFSSEENKNLFSTSPEQFAPQYGGYCAFAVSKGFTANTDPNAFKIIDDKLYLFAEESVKTEWLQDQELNINLCNKNWQQ